MQIELIETFLNLCETQNFNKTAENLGITQSTVSSRVRALEKALEAKLFQRSRSGTRLTTNGLKFEPHARRLLRNWFEAVRVTHVNPSIATTLRVGLQQDLATPNIGNWVQEFRKLFPDTTLYIEADYSIQMCKDLLTGMLDLALVFSPQPHPDLHFESVGTATCRMVSTQISHINDVRVDDYILSNISPAFATAHSTLHPALSQAAVSSGQDSVVTSLLEAVGGTAYLMDESAKNLIESGICQEVIKAPLIEQSIYAAVHMRNRHRSSHKRLIKLLHYHISKTET